MLPFPFNNFCLNIEETQKSMTSHDINNRLEKVVTSPSTFNTKHKDCWEVSFEEGVDPLDLNEDALPKEDKTEQFYDLKLIHTQWRYDYGFTTPSGIFMYPYSDSKNNVD